MGKGWSLRSGSCSQKGQEEVCSSGRITENLTEATQSASSPPRPRPLSLGAVPVRGARQVLPTFREPGCQADGACQPAPKGSEGRDEWYRDRAFIPEIP